MDALTPPSEVPSEEIPAAAPAEAALPGAAHRAKDIGQKVYTHGRTDRAFYDAWIAAARKVSAGYIMRRDWIVRGFVLGIVASPFVARAIQTGRIPTGNAFERNTFYACTAGFAALCVTGIAVAYRETHQELNNGDYDKRLVEGSNKQQWPGGNSGKTDEPTLLRKRVAKEMGFGAAENYPFPNAYLGPSA